MARSVCEWGDCENVAMSGLERCSLHQDKGEDDRRKAFDRMREALAEVLRQARFTAPWGSPAIVLPAAVERRVKGALALANRTTEKSLDRSQGTRYRARQGGDTR